MIFVNVIDYESADDLWRRTLDLTQDLLFLTWDLTPDLRAKT